MRRKRLFVTTAAVVMSLGLFSTSVWAENLPAQEQTALQDLTAAQEQTGVEEQVSLPDIAENESLIILQDDTEVEPESGQTEDPENNAAPEQTEETETLPSSAPASEPETKETVQPVVKSIPLTGITLNKKSAKIVKGKTLALKVTYKPSNTTAKKTVKWTSSNKKVAVVSAKGKITAKSVGTATITAKCGSKKAICKITVKKAVPLKSITLSKKALTLKAGKSKTLTVTYTPKNTTVTKKVTWKSSNKKVATVNANGKITAKKPGTATITAKCGKKKATCKVTVKWVAKGSFWNVSEAYTLLNKFRTTKSNQWYWNSDNKTKFQTGALGKLKRDAALEKIAKMRAQEQWQQFYLNGKMVHDRPDGSSFLTAYPESSNFLGECLAWGQSSCKMVITDGTLGWAETDLQYAGQAHRRCMLSDKATRVGIACYEENGRTCWVLCTGY